MTKNSVSTLGIGFLLLMVSGCGDGSSQSQVGEAGAGQAGGTVGAGGPPCMIPANGQPERGNCFVIDLSDPVLGGEPPVQPIEVDGPVHRVPNPGQPPMVVLDSLPDYVDVEPQLIRLWHDPAPADPENPHPDTHEHEGGASGSGHCHYWYQLSNGSYIQVHC